MRVYAARDRRRRNVLSFGDLLLLTARVLRENADVRAALERLLKDPALAAALGRRANAGSRCRWRIWTSGCPACPPRIQHWITCVTAIRDCPKPSPEPA